MEAVKVCSEFIITHTGLVKQIFERNIVNISLPISSNTCFVCSKEPSRVDGSFEYPQHLFG